MHKICNIENIVQYTCNTFRQKDACIRLCDVLRLAYLLTTVVNLLGIVVVVVVAVVSVVSLLSLLLLGLAPTRRAPSSKFFPRTSLLDADHMSDELLALALASFCATPVVHTLASLLPVLLSLPVLQCRHLRSVRHDKWNVNLFRAIIIESFFFFSKKYKNTILTIYYVYHRTFSSKNIEKKRNLEKYKYTLSQGRALTRKGFLSIGLPPSWLSSLHALVISILGLLLGVSFIAMEQPAPTSAPMKSLL